MSAPRCRRARPRSSTPALLGLAMAAALCRTAPAHAQELEPGAYWPLPRGLNVLTIVNQLSVGDITFEPSLPIDEASATINATVTVYTRALGLGGRSANVSVQFPIVAGRVEGIYQGQPAERKRFGQGDPRIRLGVNLYGAPAMTPKAFAGYRLRTVVGASVTVVPPLGQYHPAQVINIGTHRWSVKTEAGVAHAKGPWVVELMGGVWVFTSNDDFAGGRTRSQRPIGSTQAHLTYRFRRNMWLAADANYYTGGRTALDGVPKLDLLRNARIGSTFSAALTRHHSIRVSISQGAYTTIGGAYTTLAAGYSYAWLD